MAVPSLLQQYIQQLIHDYQLTIFWMQTHIADVVISQWLFALQSFSKMYLGDTTFPDAKIRTDKGLDETESQSAVTWEKGAAMIWRSQQEMTLPDHSHFV